MLFDISHTSLYTYSEQVFFEPHYFRFKPKNTPHSVLKDFTINIEPDSSGLSEQVDIENNYIFFCWFDGTHQQMRIKTHSIVEVHEYNPFHFLVHPPEYLKLPFAYDKKTKPLLKPLLNSIEIPESMIIFCDEVLLESGNGSIDFLVQITKRIHKEFSLISRATGTPHQPDYTFHKKTGSCRDLAWMQIHMLRHLGIASRFVSGYYFIQTENPEFELHAWVEIFLPGVGWIGLDPSHGILTNAYHIPVASSALHENTMPVTGTIRGNSDAKLKHELEISLVV